MLLLLSLSLLVGAASASASASAAGGCSFCTTTATDTLTWDLSSLPAGTFSVDEYTIASVCANAKLPFGSCSRLYSPQSPAIQFGRYDLGALGNETVVSGDASGLNVTLNNPDPTQTPNCGGKLFRTSTYHFICDSAAPANNPPEDPVVEAPGCHYNIFWKHPAACPVTKPGQSCSSPHPSPPPPPPKPSGSNGCTPNWKPTWAMNQSTILYACNETGFHSVDKAIQYGVVVYDWSNAKQIWANTHPMTDEELLTKQAEMVLAADPGLGPEYQQRVWVYRNTIKALNWYTSVREKLDDPAYAGWFIKFKDYKGPSSNQSYHVPACTYEKCSGFYHDQEQTPEYPHGDGTCVEECDCGKAPCGEYIFDHRNESFSDWFVHEYMISNETLLHQPLAIGLGWMDDSMTMNGPTEENKYFINDTGSTHQDMVDMVAAYKANVLKFNEAVVAAGGFTWMLIRGSTPNVRTMAPSDADKCADTLREWCSPEATNGIPAALYKVNPKDIVGNETQYTSEFLLARGPYAWLGYSWAGCGGTDWPRPSLWDIDVGGEPAGVCAETGDNTRVFTRSYPKATVSWDCNAAKGDIQMK